MIEPIEYPGRAERALLITAGTGLMLSLMDQCPRLRWCLDADGLTPADRPRFGDWLAGMSRRVHLVAFAGWYCSTDPSAVVAALRRVDTSRRLVYAQCHGKHAQAFGDLGTAAGLAAFVRQVNEFPAADPIDAAIQESGASVRRLSWDEYCATAR